MRSYGTYIGWYDKSLVEIKSKSKIIVDHKQEMKLQNDISKHYIY